MMTQSKTRVKFLLKLAMLLPLFAGLSLMLGCEPATNEISDEIESVDEVTVEILNDNALLVNEEPMTSDELEVYLSELPESPELVRMKVNPDAEFGVITDVQTILRKYEALRINYSKVTDGEPDSLEEMTDLFLKAADEYMKIDPDSMSEEELQREYEIVTELYEEILNFENKDPQAPPPPPMVPSPEKRLESDYGHYTPQLKFNSISLNLFDSTIQVKYEVPEMGSVVLDLFDDLGKRVATLVQDDAHPQGVFNLEFDAKGLNNGVYIARLEQGDKAVSKKMLQIK